MINLMIMINQELQTLLGHTVQKPEIEPKQIATREASAFAAEDEQRQRVRADFKTLLASVSLCSPILRCLGGKLGLILEFQNQFRNIS